MTENEAKQVLEKAIEQSVIAIEKLNAIESDVERTDKVGEYYSILENCVREQESCSVAIKALEEIQMYKQGGLCLVPTDVYMKQCDELDSYKEIGTTEEIKEKLALLEKYENLGTIEELDETLNMFC